MNYIAFPKLTKTKGLQLIVVILYFTCGCLSAVQNDSWWHLSAGEFMYSHREILMRDVSTYTVLPGAVWLNHEWLSQIIIYCAYHFGGLPSLGILYGIIVASYALIIISFSPTDLKSSQALMCAMPFVMLGLSVRPLPFTYDVVVLGVALLSTLRLCFLPMVVAIGANLHGGCFFIAIPIIILNSLNVRYRFTPFVKLCSISLACLIATFITPLGLGLYKVVLDFMSLPKFLTLYELTPGYKIPWVVLGIGISCLALVMRFRASKRGYREQFFLLCALVFAGLALKGVRNVPLYGLLWAFAFANQTASGRPLLNEEKSIAKNTWVVIITAAFSWIAIAACYMATITRLGWHPLSDAAIKAIRSCKEPVFNSYDVGGYLMWFIPERKIFIDSRYHPFEQNFVKETLRAQVGDYRDLFEKYHFKCAVFEPNLALGAALLANGWKETFGDETIRVLSAPGV